MAEHQAAFRALHSGDMFVMPNPWDAGTAKMLAGMGFKALASSSAALAWTLGAADIGGSVTGQMAVEHAATLASASGLPVNGDFESGYGDTPADVGDTIARAIDAGIAGCSIEDIDQAQNALYPLDEACRRLEAAAEAVAKSGSDFMLTGRCEVMFLNHPDPFSEALKRLKAYEGLGVDALYAPNLTREEQIRAIVDAISLPLNVLFGLGGVSNDLDTLRRLGVARVSIGSGLAKVALGAFQRAARELALGNHAFELALSGADIHAAMGVDET